MNFNEDEEQMKVKGKMVAITTLSVIGFIIIFIMIGMVIIKSFFTDFGKHQYHVVKVNNDNKENIISLLENENLKYCESIYKIEYERVFTGDIISKLYCQKEDNILLSIYDNESQLIQYIDEHGSVERR